MSSKIISTDEVIKQKIEESEEDRENLRQFFLKIGLSCLGDYHESEDIANESLFKSHRSSKNYNKQIDPSKNLSDDNGFKAWSGKIAKNAALKSLIKRSKFREKHGLYSECFTEEDSFLLEELAESYETADSLLIESEEKYLLKKLVSELSEKTRRTVEMYYYEKKEYKDIAQELNIPTGTVKSRLNRAKRILSEMLKELLPLVMCN